MLFIVLLAAGLAWIALGLWLYLWSPYKGKTTVKAFTTLGPVMIAFAGALLRQSTADWVLCATAVLFLLADIFICYSLVPGVLVFLAGHIGLIARAILDGAPLAAVLVPGALGCLVLAVCYRKRFAAVGASSAALIVYVFVLFGMAGAIGSLFWVPGGHLPAKLVAGLGAGCFLCSDLLLGDAIVMNRKTEFRNRWIMCLYEPAVLLLVLAPYTA